MRHPRHRLPAELTERFADIRADLAVPDAFPPEVTAVAQERARQGPLPHDRADRRDVELLSIDPAGSRDLDQALHLARDGSGFTFHYAIADLGSWIEPGDALDVEARRRGATIYSPDVRTPLHPVELSEGAASLLAGPEVPAVLWTIRLDQRGEVSDHRVERALVRNRRALSYAEVQAAVDAGTTDEQFRLLQEVGELRLERERERGGISLELPEQRVERVGADGHYELSYEEAVVVEAWNAQLSLCCGMVAATIMIEAGVGILRTLPPPEAGTLDELRLRSLALGVPWPDGTDYPTWVRSLDPATPAGAALTTQAARTLRGSGYLAFDGTLPAEHAHHAIAADYAHVTAPLRRLVDRYANECVLAAASGVRPDAAVVAALADLPADMSRAAHTAGQVDSAVVEVAEAASLEHRVGDRFEAVVTSTSRGRSTVLIRDPAVITALDGELPLGTTVTVRLAAADHRVPTTRFDAVPAG